MTKIGCVHGIIRDILAVQTIPDLQSTEVAVKSGNADGEKNMQSREKDA